MFLQVYVTNDDTVFLLCTVLNLRHLLQNINLGRNEEITFATTLTRVAKQMLTEGSSQHHKQLQRTFMLTIIRFLTPTLTLAPPLSLTQNPTHSSQFFLIPLFELPCGVYDVSLLSFLLCLFL